MKFVGGKHLHLVKAKAMVLNSTTVLHVNKAYVTTAVKYIYFEDNADTVYFLNKNEQV